VADEPDRDRLEKILQAYLDAFKHYGTLSAALAVVVLVLYSELRLNPFVITVCLVILGVSVVASTLGFFVAATIAMYEGPLIIPSFASRILHGLLYISNGGVGAGVIVLIIAGIGLLP
jgi:hypothetical protein